MKRLILSEGQNDTFFLRELLTTKLLIPDEKILSFDQGTREIHKSRKAIQQRYFDRLLTGHESFDILIKSEGGKSKIIPVTASQLIYLCKQRCTPVILIDIDNDSMVTPLKKKIDSFIKDLKSEIEMRFKNQQFVIKQVYVDKTKEAELWVANILCKTNNNCYGQIYIIGFYRTLEKEIGMDKKKDKDSVMLMKVKKFIKNSTIHQLFSTALE
ncbi:MAG: hypothetical protein ABIG84_00635 [archaeon]